jgi:hypothetical protein
MIAAELAQPVDPRAAAMAAAIAARHPSARAVLFYGSCLREAQLDGLMLDFYLIVGEYGRAYATGWEARANRLLPPNVYPFEHDGLAAKYAVLSEADFARLCGPAAREPSTMARFAQPARVAWTADAAATAGVTASIALAVETLLRLVRPTMLDDAVADPLAGWRAAFALTYRAELRAERAGRGDSIVAADPGRYARIAVAAGWPFVAAVDADARRAAADRWRRMQAHGRRIHLARLAKASATFAGGIDYLAWKINRHAGTAIAIRPWQRRHPILGAISLLPRLLRGGAVR